MDEERTLRRVSEAICMSTRSRGRPRARWREEVERDLRAMGITNWRRIARDREQHSVAG